MSKTDFQIDQKLMTDAHHLGFHKGFHILLHKNATIPWVILVPETDVQEIYQLSENMQKLFFALSTKIASFMKSTYHVDKMNVAAIGNIVSQLHIHVIARRYDDACWPDVVWGKNYQITSYTSQELSIIKENLLKESNIDL